MKIATFHNKRESPVKLGIVLENESRKILDLSSEIAHRLMMEAGADLNRPSDIFSLMQVWSDEFRRQFETLIASASREQKLKEEFESTDDVIFRAPIERPRKLVCLAGNYREHITESGFAAPAEKDVITQQLFLKPSTCIIGDGEDILIEHNNIMVGWETELAVVIGKRGKHIAAEEAYNYVFGYTILNDVTERRLNSKIENRKHRELDRFFDWLGGKWFDTFAPCGPWLVTADEISDPHDLDITLTINGEVRQRGNTRDMIFRIPEQIAYISSIMTLEPGDIISTGTPAGAGVGASTSLGDGDELVCEIEKIGKLSNRVRCAD